MRKPGKHFKDDFDRDPVHLDDLPHQDLDQHTDQLPTIIPSPDGVLLPPEKSDDAVSDNDAALKPGRRKGKLIDADTDKSDFSQEAGGVRGDPAE